MLKKPSERQRARRSREAHVPQTVVAGLTIVDPFIAVILGITVLGDHDGLDLVDVSPDHAVLPVVADEGGRKWEKSKPELVAASEMK